VNIRPATIVVILAGAITVTRRRVAVARGLHPIAHRVKPITSGLPTIITRRRGIFPACPLIPDGWMHVPLCRIVVTLNRLPIPLAGILGLSVFLAHTPMLAPLNWSFKTASIDQR
jgi:hypothetical protein